MVTRHLLTLFVLLSGLTALQAPVHASTAETVATHARTIAGGYEALEANHEHCAFVAEARAEATERASDTPFDFEAAPIALLSAPYVFGVERALE